MVDDSLETPKQTFGAINERKKLRHATTTSARASAVGNPGGILWYVRRCKTRFGANGPRDVPS